MSFSENLQTLRKAQGISQEQLAERLDVSRQAVSKWETDGGYPEMDKIVQLCGIFNCSMDELVTGKVSVDKPADRKLYDAQFNRFAKGIGIGTALIIFGTALAALFSALGEMSGYHLMEEGIAPAVFVMLVAVAIALFIIFGVEHDGFRKANQTMPELYTLEEKERFNKRFGAAVAIAVAAIIIALLPIIIVEAIEEDSILTDLVTVPIFLTVLAAALGLIVYMGIQYGKYDIERYNLDNAKEYGDGTADVQMPTKRKRLADKACGVIMLTATMIFVGIGLITNEWHPTWVVFPIGGILCAIVNVIFDE